MVVRLRRDRARSLSRLIVALVCAWPTATVHAALEPPQEVKVYDTPSDGGGSLTVTWPPAPYDGPEVTYQIMVSRESGSNAPVQDQARSGGTMIAEIPSDTQYVRDAKLPWWSRPAPLEFHLYKFRGGSGLTLEDDVTYAVRVVAARGDERAEARAQSATPAPNWINWNSINNLLLALMFGAGLFWSIRSARRAQAANQEIFLRRIPGLDAVDEAIGRATELGKPILYLTGAGDMGEPSTIAAAVILGRVGKRVAAYETELIVPHRDPIVMAVCQEITKQSYLEAGKADIFKEDSNFFITTDQFSYTAAVDGIMLRRKPAANFFMGSYYAESLLLTETGASTGAIQIAGTDSDHQMPFFVTTCDYTLIGEELYAASAYLSREPVQVGTLRSQDLGKAIILGVLAAGTVLATVGLLLDVQWQEYLLDFFRDLK